MDNVAGRVIRTKCFRNWPDESEKLLLKLWKQNKEYIRNGKNTFYLLTQIAFRIQQTLPEGQQVSPYDVKTKIQDIARIYWKETRKIRSGIPSDWPLYAFVHALLSDPTKDNATANNCPFAEVDCNDDATIMKSISHKIHQISNKMDDFNKRSHKLYDKRTELFNQLLAKLEGGVKTDQQTNQENLRKSLAASVRGKVSDCDKTLRASREANTLKRKISLLEADQSQQYNAAVGGLSKNENQSENATLNCGDDATLQTIDDMLEKLAGKVDYLNDYCHTLQDQRQACLKELETEYRRIRAVRYKSPAANRKSKHHTNEHSNRSAVETDPLETFNQIIHIDSDYSKHRLDSRNIEMQ